LKSEAGSVLGRECEKNQERASSSERKNEAKLFVPDEAMNEKEREGDPRQHV